MAILDQIPQSIYGRQGQVIDPLPGSSGDSTLHYTSSLNNNPSIERPSTQLGLQGQSQPRYLDNPPQ